MVHLHRKQYGDSLKKKKYCIIQRGWGIRGYYFILVFFFNIVIRGSPEQRCEGNPMNIWGRASRQREDQMLKLETGAHLAVSSSKEASVGEGQLEKQRDEI